MRLGSTLFAGALIASVTSVLAAQRPVIGVAVRVAGPSILEGDVSVGLETHGRFGGRLTGTGTEGPWLTADLTYRLSRPASSLRVYTFGGAGVRITIGRNADPELSTGIGARLTTLRPLGPFAEIRLRHALRTAEPANRLTDT